MLFPRCYGSSPRARGTRRREYDQDAADRFIPAGAGNTAAIRARCCDAPVHPRGRGEHFVNSNGAGNPTGSSPRARGTRRGAPPRPRWGAVHPRGRGEHDQFGRHVVGRVGSSPRARGTHRQRAPGLVEQPVHPRGRGEHASAAVCCCYAAGSSPRARGTHFFHLNERYEEFERARFYSNNLMTKGSPDC